MSLRRGARRDRNPVFLQGRASEIEGWRCLFPALALGAGLGHESLRRHQELAHVTRL